MRSRIAACLALAALLFTAAAYAGSRAENGKEFEYYDEFKKASGENDAAFNYFAKAGSLTTVADSSMGVATYLSVSSAHTGQIVLWVYGKHGTTGSGGPTSTYSALLIQLASSANDDEHWESPEGMRIHGIKLLTDPTGGPVIFRVGR